MTLIGEPDCLVGHYDELSSNQSPWRHDAHEMFFHQVDNNIVQSMPKHESPLQRLIDPFSVPAQMNNLGVLIVAYVTKGMMKDQQCTDPENAEFLNFIYYGSIIVCGGTFLLSAMYIMGLLDYCISRVMPCGQVCLTLNTLTVFLAGIVYHCVATIYGVLELYWGVPSPCVELEMFKEITCMIYLCWLVCIVCYLIFRVYKRSSKGIPIVEESYVQM